MKINTFLMIIVLGALMSCGVSFGMREMQPQEASREMMNALEEFCHSIPFDQFGKSDLKLLLFKINMWLASSYKNEDICKEIKKNILNTLLYNNEQFAANPYIKNFIAQEWKQVGFRYLDWLQYTVKAQSDPIFEKELYDAYIAYEYYIDFEDLSSESENG
jgi:hypothetical protein